MAYEAGLKPWELRRVTLRDFNAMYVGYRRRQEELWDMHRRTWGYIIGFAGMGIKKGEKLPTPQELWELPYRDAEAKAAGGGQSAAEKAKPITTEEEALELLKQFE